MELVKTLVQGKYDLNLKKTGQELQDVQRTQEISAAAVQWQMHSIPDFHPGIQ